MIDPAEILKEHLSEVTLSDQEREDVAATFHRLVELGGQAVQGADVSEEMKQIEAQLALWKSGALSSTQAALQSAATEYAEEAAHYLGLVIRGAVGGLL